MSPWTGTSCPSRACISNTSVKWNFTSKYISRENVSTRKSTRSPSLFPTQSRVVISGTKDSEGFRRLDQSVEVVYRILFPLRVGGRVSVERGCHKTSR